MSKKIDLNKTVFELTKQYPELIDIMAKLGFTEITKKPVLNSVGKIMTIPKGAKMKNISMIDVVSTLLANGFELEGKMPEINIKDVKKEITSIISNFGMGLVSNLPEYALSIGKSIINGGLNFVLGLMIGFYLLFDFDKVNENIDKMLPKTWKENFRELTKRINTSLRSYVQGVLLVMFLVFLTQSIGLTLAGMEAPLLFALSRKLQHI